MSNGVLATYQVECFAVLGYDPQTLTALTPGPTELFEAARQGPPGPAAFVSASANNRTVIGADGGIYTPEVVSDFLSYYILAKA